MDKIRDINEDILNQKLEVLVQKLVFGASKPSKFEILNSSIEYFLVNKRFDVPLLWNDSLLKVFLCSCLSLELYIYIYIIYIYIYIHIAGSHFFSQPQGK